MLFLDSFRTTNHITAQHSMRASKTLSLLTAFLFVCVARASAAPPPIVASATPTTVPAASATDVTFTTTITDPSFQSANLITTDASGRSLTTVGLMHDDGLNGDATAGDKIYSYRLAINQPSPTTLYYRVSGAFRGSLLRVLSNVVAVTVAPRATINASAQPAPNQNGWNNADVTVSFSCTNTASCPPEQIVSTEGSQTVTGTATGAGGDIATASVTVNVDKTAPVVTISSPAEGFTTGNASISVAASIAGGGSPIASATCNGAPATLNGLAIACDAPLTDGANTITVAATDAAGNQGSAAVHGTRTTARPTITAQVQPAPNAAGWNNTDVIVSFTCANATSCPDPVTVTTEGANQTVSGTAHGDGGDESASVSVSIDKTAPTVAIASPANNSFAVTPSIAVEGTFSIGGSEVVSATCNNITGVTTTGGTFTCAAVPLASGPNPINAYVTDAAGNTGSATVSVNYSTGATAPGPVITFSSPNALTVFSGQQIPITVSGTVDDPNATVVITSPESPNGVQAGVQGTSWTALGIPLKEGNNQLTATGTNAQGGVSTATLTVVLDTTAPIIRIDSPVADSVLTSGEVAVSGVVNDIVPGTVNSEQVTVQVNGLDAQISNRSFTVPAMLLAHGQNTLTAIATDRAGNQSQAQIHVTLQEDVQQQRIQLVSGDQQTAAIGTQLQNPLIARLVDAAGGPVANRAVTFQVSRSDGTLQSGEGQVQQVAVLTDDQGLASVNFTLGTRNGVGNNQVTASSPGFAGSAIFTESATVGPPAQINIVSGNDQRGPIGTPLTLPYIVIVLDAGGNPVPDLAVDFKVLQGGGTIGGASELAVNTNTDGKSTALLTLGQSEGVNNNVVAVGFGGDPATLPGNQRVTFQASGLVPGNPTETRVSGVVLDNAEVPIPNATATIVGTALQARTDDQGRFSIAGAPVGTVTLIVDGATSTRPETFPFLAFVLNTVAGLDNTLGMPIYIPPLDTTSGKLAGGDEEVVLTMAGVPGVAFTIAPHSTTTPDGLHQPVKMMLSQVHADKVPMPPVNGSAPSLVWTLQPAGVHFDPPIRVQLPNTDGLSPGQVVEVYQFDHDLEQFVSTGPARVSPDGSVIVSDPGFGITKSGWGAPQPPPPPKNCTASCNDQNVCTADNLINPPCVCQNPPANDGAACGDEPGANSCKEKGVCQGGACTGAPKPSGSSCDDNVFCTENDQCDAGGGCKGTAIPEKQGPNVTVEIKFDWVKEAIEQYISKFLPIKNTSITFSTEGNEKDICCESKQQKDVAVKTVKWSGNIKVETDKLFIPSLSFNIKVVKIGVFAKFGVGLQVFLQGENDFCQGNGVCWGGGIQLAGNVEFGVAAEDAAKVVSMSASCQSGLELDANVSCKEYQIGLSSQPVKCKINVELFDGFIAFGLEKELLPSYPLIGGQKNPLPDLQ